MKICLVIPTRGVLFARTVHSTILNPELPLNTSIVIVEGLPIPDAHNECIRRALQTDCTHILFVEEDMEVPPTAIAWMMKAAEQHRIVLVDYKVRSDVKTIQYDDKGILFFGFGCTMIDRTVFEKEFTDPWLTAKYALSIREGGKYEPYEIAEGQDVYGKYDVYFGWQCRQKGIAIAVMSDVLCKHLRLQSWERKESNNGVHQVYEI